jgi:hypothetical protein
LEEGDMFCKIFHHPNSSWITSWSTKQHTTQFLTLLFDCCCFHVICFSWAQCGLWRQILSHWVW